MNSTTTPAKVRISHSQIGSFTSCAYKWHLQYRQGLRVRTNEVAPATLGDAVHYGIAAALRKVYEWRKEYYPIGYHHIQETVNAALNEWSVLNRPSDRKTITVNGGQISLDENLDFYAEWDAMVFNAKALALRVLQHIELLERYDIVEHDGQPLVEYDIRLDIPDTQFEFAGRIDAVLRNRNTGLIEVVDWKVRGRFTDIESEQLNNQIGLYQYALRQIGINAQVGVVYQIKNEAPKRPSVNKDGSMSRRKIITTWEVYRDALLDTGLDPADYEAEMREKLADIEFFRPLLVVRSDKVTSALWDNMTEQAKRISNETRFPRSYGYPCRSCPFAELCNAELYGYDVEGLMQTRYEVYERPIEVDDEGEQPHE